MSATLFYLARNPSCYQELAREIRSEFNNADEICGTAVSNCHYLRACIDEALRMSPPAPGTLWRHLAPEEEAAGPFIVDGHVIPNGTKVGVNIYSLHHNEVGTIHMTKSARIWRFLEPCWRAFFANMLNLSKTRQLTGNTEILSSTFRL